MANLTIAVDDETLRRARIRAVEEGTSINAVLREHLESYAGVHAERRAALLDLLELSQTSGAEIGGASWTRDELHER